MFASNDVWHTAYAVCDAQPSHLLPPPEDWHGDPDAADDGSDHDDDDDDFNAGANAGNAANATFASASAAALLPGEVKPLPSSHTSANTLDPFDRES
jgi:hypothetical protein